MKQLSDKQLRFVELFNGNAMDTAALVGYKYPKDAGSRALKNVEICRLIQERRKTELKPNVKTRIQRQEFWSRVMEDEEKEMRERLKASELLGKSEGDFLDRVENSGEISLSIKWAD